MVQKDSKGDFGTVWMVNASECRRSEYQCFLCKKQTPKVSTADCPHRIPWILGKGHQSFQCFSPIFSPIVSSCLQFVPIFCHFFPVVSQVFPVFANFPKFFQKIQFFSQFATAQFARFQKPKQRSNRWPRWVLQPRFFGWFSFSQFFKTLVNYWY